MRASYLVLLAWAAFAGAATAQDGGNAATAQPRKTDVAPIHFDLAQPRPAKGESLPAAATLGDLTYANEKPRAAAEAAPAVAPKPERAVVAKPSPRAATKVAPKVVAARPAAKPAAAKPANGPWMSEWRRAYIARHGHQPPVPAPPLRH